MSALASSCRVLENIWISPTVMRIRFQALVFPFHAGQFLSVIVPPTGARPTSVKRCYSFASSPTEAKTEGYYELCVKYVPGGVGSAYLAGLQRGDIFSMMAPYGDMRYQSTEAGRSVCFIGTGTGIAPFRSILFSREFQRNRPENVLLLHGVRNEMELIYRANLDKCDIDARYAVSQPTEAYNGFKGRVTDLLASLPHNWDWQGTDFYICGAGEMVKDVTQILKTKGVSDLAVHREIFSPYPTKPVSSAPTVESAALLLPWKKVA